MPIASAVEELARFDGLAQIAFRYALEDVSLQNTQIRRGELVAAVIAAANRDPDKFADPDDLNFLTWGCVQW